jgi:hypothetical protein
MNDDEEIMPDFILCGGPNGRGGVRLLASKVLIEAVLDVQVQYPDIWDTILRSRLKTRVFLNTEMGDAVTIDAPTYPEAIKALAELWGNNWSSNKEITQGQGEIEDGEQFAQ